MVADLTLKDISNIIRLVREVCDRWDDPRAWREHLLRGVCEMVHGHVGLMLADVDGREGNFGRLAVISVVGLPSPMRPLVEPAIGMLAERGYQDVDQNILPGVANMYGQIVKQGWVTASRSQLVDEESYHAAPYYQNFHRLIDADDFVTSIRIVDIPRRAEGMVIDRPHGAVPFGDREVALLKLLHDEIAPLIGVKLATEEHLCRDGLSRRLRQVLSLLLEGKSEKEVARTLSLGGRTVHEYVTMLYEHFRVSSRAELLAYFIRREPVERTPRAKRAARAGAAPPR